MLVLTMIPSWYFESKTNIHTHITAMKLVCDITVMKAIIIGKNVVNPINLRQSYFNSVNPINLSTLVCVLYAHT